MTQAEGSGVRKVEYEPAEPVDVVAVAGAPIAKRVAPVLAAIAVIVALIVVVRGRS